MSKFNLGLLAIIFSFTWIMVGDHHNGGKTVSASPTATWPKIAIELVVAGLESPVHLTHSGDGSGRLFIVEQSGRIMIFDGGLFETPFLDIADRVRSPSSGGGGEEGLLSVAFPPGYGSTSDYFYVYYTNLEGDNQVSKFSLTSNPDLGDPQSEELIIRLLHPEFGNHNGGQLFFGPDGFLYIGTGDGGGGGDPKGNAQDPTELLGKILRIDVEPITFSAQSYANLYHLPLVLHNSTRPPDSQPYRIPPDNPFVSKPGYRGEIWAFGLRNPWRFSFDRGTGDLYIGDVGQNSQEEIDHQPFDSPGGENYGWSIMEGDECYIAASCDTAGLTLPVVVYHHNHSGGHENCSVTGGYVYRGQQFAEMQGIYIFADYCSGIIWGLQLEGGNWVTQELLDTSAAISSFGEDEDGELFLTDHWGGQIFRILATK